MATPKRRSVPQEDQRDLYNLFRVASRAMMGAFRNFSEPPHELSVHHVRILLCLAQFSDRTQSVSELAKELRWSLGWTSRTLNPLRKKGLINCTRDTRDRRLVYVNLTADGVLTAHLIMENLGKPMIAALEDVVPKQRRVIKEFLRRFSEEINRIPARSSIAVSTAKMSGTESERLATDAGSLEIRNVPLESHHRRAKAAS